MKKSLSILLSIALAIGAFAENYAVLITGCEPNLPPVTPEYDQFWNDTYLMWESLWQFGWKDENIFVLFGNGADWDTTNQRYSPRLQNQSDPRFPIVITDDSAYYDDVVETFDYLEQTMTNSDFLFIWTFDHGRISSLGDTILCLMGGDSIPDYEFADMLNDIPFNKRVIWMAQCNSGGFLDNLSNNNTVFMSACQALESSFQADNNYPDGGDSLENDYFAPQDYYHHSEFDYHVFNALRLETIVEYHPLTEPDTNDDGNASLPEIYDWEIHHNSLYAEIQIVPPYETTWVENAQYSDPGNIGSTIFLNIPPYPPENLTWYANENDHPVLEWELNTEYDINQYKVYRLVTNLNQQQIPDPEDYVCIATLDHYTNSYTDTEVLLHQYTYNRKLWYYVTALDLASNESLPSNEIHFVGLWHPSGGEAGEIAGIPASNRIGLSASPNPFNNYTNLKISLPKAGNVEVKIYDIAGKEVASLYQGYYSTGIFELHWNASDLPSGVYFARLTAGGFTQTQKILLMK